MLQWIKIIILIFALQFTNEVRAQRTYTVGDTEYFYGKYYKTTGKPMVKRSLENKKRFLRSKGLKRTPVGYEIDHIIPLSFGGSDSPKNMQLLTKAAHAAKTTRERQNPRVKYYARKYYRQKHKR
jgi:5-methylcytosine-specific restriction endonuclease McrA